MQFFKIEDTGFLKEKKTLEPIKSAPNRDDWDRVLLSRDEYERVKDTFLVECQQLENEKYEVYAKQQELQAQMRQAQSEQQKVQWDCEKKLAEMQARIEAAEHELQAERQKNQGLRRITIERSNAERGLKPKKQHSGYVLLSSEPFKLKAYQSRYEKAIFLFRTKIQTPWPVTLHQEDVLQAVREILRPSDGQEALIKRLGITAAINGGYDEVTAEQKKKNVLLYANDLELRTNFRSGFFDLTITHTQPLDAVPADVLGAGPQSVHEAYEKV